MRKDQCDCAYDKTNLLDSPTGQFCFHCDILVLVLWEPSRPIQQRISKDWVFDLMAGGGVPTGGAMVEPERK